MQLKIYFLINYFIIFINMSGYGKNVALIFWQKCVVSKLLLDVKKTIYDTTTVTAKIQQMLNELERDAKRASDMFKTPDRWFRLASNPMDVQIFRMKKFGFGPNTQAVLYGHLDCLNQMMSCPTPMESLKERSQQHLTLFHELYDYGWDWTVERFEHYWR